MNERATVPFGFSLAGLVVSAVAALLVGIAGSGMFGTYNGAGMMGGMMGGYNYGGGMMTGYSPWMMSGWGGYVWMWIPIVTASIALASLGVFMINSSRVGNVQLGSVLVLVAAVLAFPTAFGFIVGSVLMVVGGVLGLVWTPGRESSL